jgi:hypothetical protein
MSDAPIELQLAGVAGGNGASAFDFSVRNSDGLEVATSRHVVAAPPPPGVTRIAVGSLISATLKPHENRQWQYAWMQRDDSGLAIKPGDYYVVGSIPLASGTSLRSPPVRIRITKPAPVRSSSDSADHAG